MWKEGKDASIRIRGKKRRNSRIPWLLASNNDYLVLFAYIFLFSLSLSLSRRKIMGEGNRNALSRSLFLSDYTSCVEEKSFLREWDKMLIELRASVLKEIERDRTRTQLARILKAIAQSRVITDRPRFQPSFVFFHLLSLSSSLSNPLPLSLSVSPSYIRQ